VEAGLMALRHNPQTRKTTMMTTKDKVARRKLSLLELAAELSNVSNHPANLSITHISDVVFALSESFVILFVTPIRGGVTDERGEGSRYIWLA
jgi:hypothetical protein